MNVLILVLDAARRDRFGCYGSPRGTTPAIDDLARGGLLFEQMISTSSWTIPSHASLFTGLYPRENGGASLRLMLRPGHVTLAQHLRSNGYATAFISRNPLVSQRTGLVDELGIAIGRHQLYGEGRGRFSSALARRLKVLLGQMDQGAAAANRVVVNLLRRQPGPFFVFVNYMECHWPYTATRPFERRFVRRRYPAIEAAIRRVWMRRHHPWDPGLVRNQGDLDLIGDLYDGALAYMDRRVGDLLEALDASGQAGRTVVVVLADHGEFIGDHGLIGHGMHLYDPLIRVPFIARIPGREATRIEGLVQLTDVFAGLCGALGLDVPDQIQDRPFAVDPFRLQPGQPGRKHAFAEFHRMPERVERKHQMAIPDFRSSPTIEMVQDTQFKLVVEAESGKESLFNLGSDPGEMSPVTDGLTAERARLRVALQQWQTLLPSADAQAVYSAEEEQALNARLEELGYI